MRSLARGDLEGAHLQTNIVPVVVRSRNELGTMAASFNTMQLEVKNAALGLDGAREGLQAARAELTQTNEKLRGEVREQEQLAAELTASRDAAEAGNRSKAEFLAMISHELRTPLNGVIGMARLLLDGTLDPRSRRYAETLRDAGDHLLQLINDLLDYSKIEADQLAFEDIVFDLDLVVRAALDLIAPRSQAKGLHIAKYVAPDIPPMLIGDPGRLRQVLINLLGNAVKFTEAGSISLEVRRLRADDGTAQLEFAVRDTGIGIEPENLPLLFQVFTQGDSSISRRFGGTGLGLAICKSLVSRMGGTIRVESQLNRGSTFRFTGQFNVSSAPPLEDERLDGQRISIIDVDEVNASVVRREIAESGARVDLLSDPADAVVTLQRAAADGAPFDAALVYRTPPALDGENLARAIGAGAGYPPPRLVLTSADEPAPAERIALEAMFDVVMAQPISRNLLVRALSPSDMTVTGAKAEPSSTTEGAPAGRIRVLVAEDNPSNQMVISAFLEKAGARADVVGNGLKAVAAMRERPYDLVLMDVMMPELDGVSATRQIRGLPGKAGRAPIVGLTANTTPEDHEGFLSAGMDTVLTKPIRYQQVKRLISDERWFADRARM